jgi:hypothetical protein
MAVSTDDLYLFSIDIEIQEAHYEPLEEDAFPEGSDDISEVVDTYDRTGRIRFREKDDLLRICLEVPLGEIDEENVHRSLRIDLKPADDHAKAKLYAAREMIRNEDCFFEFKKKGLRTSSESGQLQYLNKLTNASTQNEEEVNAVRVENAYFRKSPNCKVWRTTVRKYEMKNSFGDQKIEWEDEREYRRYIERIDDKLCDWVNEFVDYYDAAKRVRIRVKNKTPRISIKVPVYHEDRMVDGVKVKYCMRIEAKPEEQSPLSKLLNEIRDNLMESGEADPLKKEGGRLVDGNTTMWVNKGNSGPDKDRYWYEEDIEPNEELPEVPPGLRLV